MNVLLTALVLYASAASAVPGLHVEFWYGQHQTFGALGRPQAQINILGNVKSGAGLAELWYSLDGAPELPLSFGPDTRRLQYAGDFNIELFLEDLTPGLHKVVVRAVDQNKAEVSRAMTFTLAPDAVWPLPYAINWQEVNNILSAAQPVDGEWMITPEGVRCPAMGYDRLLAIGDMAWTNYDVRVPITIHRVDPLGYLPPSNTPGVGLIFRWNGHTDFFKPGSQPSVGYWPLGAAGEYVYHLDQCGARLQLYGNPFVLQDQDDTCTPVEFEVTYIWRMRVRTLTNGKHSYKLKVWEEGTPEPVTWTLTMVEEVWQPAHGCMLLFAHHVDATFGNVEVTPIITGQTAAGGAVPFLRTGTGQ